MSNEIPRYELTEAAFIDDKLLAVGDTVDFSGIPGYHMLPLNEAAKAMAKKHEKKYIDPILALTII